MTGNVLVTGGAGFIGRNLVCEILKTNAKTKVWILDNLHPQVHGADAKFPNFGENVKCVQGDVTDVQAISRVVREAQPVLVYHLAAETGTGQSYDDVTRYCQVNVMGTAHLVEALRKESKNATRRVVLAGSRAVYGEGGYRDSKGREFIGLTRNPDDLAKGRFSVPVPMNFHAPIEAIPSHAGLPTSPTSVYASTKLMQENLLRQSGEGASWCATILRFQNVYGPGQSLRNPYTGVLSIFCEQLLSGKTLEIFEDGDITRDFVYVDDVVSALVLAGQKELPHGVILDIGMGKPITIRETAEMLIKALGYPEDRFIVTGKFRIGDIRHACSKIEMARSHLSWEPKVSVNDGLNRLAAWALSQNNLRTPVEG
jgi:dTDP-L-rhamnose 4-epimerase